MEFEEGRSRNEFRLHIYINYPGLYFSPPTQMSSATIDASLGYSISLLVAAGGAAGYAKARSVPSLVAGVGSGLAIAYGTMRAHRRATDVGVIVGASTILLGLMGKKYLASGKFMPAGLISVLCLALLGRFAPRLF